MKIAFAGTPEIAATILQSIIDKKDHQVVCVITSVDKPAGRGRKLKPSPVKKIALETLLYLKNQLLIAEKFEISEPTMERQIINLLKDNEIQKH